MTWLRREILGRPVWCWLLCLVAVAVALVWLRNGWVAGLVAWAFSLLRPTARVAVSPPDAPDPARTALDAHQAALETDRALIRVANEARARGEVGRQAAATDPADEVAARVAAMGRKP